MIRLDLVRRVFDRTMLETIGAHFPDDAAYQWLGVNVPQTPDKARLLVITALNPGRSTSQELGGPEALAIRDGVYIVTFSLPDKYLVDDVWQLCGELEERFRRQRLTVSDCAVWCDEPYTENRGNDPSEGRYLISTTIPWSVVY